MPVEEFNVLIYLLNFIELWNSVMIENPSSNFFDIFELAIKSNDPSKYFYNEEDNTNLQEIVDNVKETSGIVNSELAFKTVGRRISTWYTDKDFEVNRNVFNLNRAEFEKTYNRKIDEAIQFKNAMIPPLLREVYQICQLQIIIDSSVPKERKPQIADELILPINNDLFEFINKQLILDINPDDSIKTVNLRLSEYYVFIITLFIFDACHDFLNKDRFRDKDKPERDDPNPSKFVTKANALLSKNLKLIADEWAENFEKLNDDILDKEQESPAYFLSICKREDINLLNDEWGIIYTTTNGVRFEAKVATVINIFLNNPSSERYNTVECINKYKAVNNNVALQNSNNKYRFMSDNAMLAFKRKDGNHGSLFNYNMLFFKNKDHKAKDIYCKSLPANIYDGIISCKCNSIVNYLKLNLDESIYKGGLEFGNYNILFSATPDFFKGELRTKLPSLNIISKFVNQNNIISQEITIKRNNRYFKSVDGVSGDYSNSECCYIYKLIEHDKIINYSVTAGNEYSGFTISDKNHIVNNFIQDTNHIIDDRHFGAFIGATNNPMQDLDIICYVRKALCDFGQYINGVFKNGGYINGQIYRDNTVVEPIPTGDFPFVCLHGDEPACVLNTFLLRTLKPNDINSLSHTVYCVSNGSIDTTVFANMHGNLLTCPVESEGSGEILVRNDKRRRSENTTANQQSKKKKKPIKALGNKLGRSSNAQQSQTRKRKKPSIKGGSHTEFTQKKHAFEILRRFFLLSFLFKMDSKYFKVFNKFCDDYYFKMDNSEILNNEQLFNERLSEIKRINDEVDLKEKHNNNHKAITMTERIVHNNPHENVKSNKAKTSMIYPHPDKVSKTQGYNDLINAKIKSKHTPASPKHSKQHKHNKVKVTNSNRKSSKNKTHKNHNHKNVENHNHKNVAKHLNVKPIPIFNNQDQVTV